MSRIKDLRKKKQYTQLTMARLTGINRSTYSRLERGQQQLTTVQCIKIALALDTSTDYLVGLTNEPIPHQRKNHLPFRADDS